VETQGKPRTSSSKSDKNRSIKKNPTLPDEKYCDKSARGPNVPGSHGESGYVRRQRSLSSHRAQRPQGLRKSVRSHPWRPKTEREKTPKIAPRERGPNSTIGGGRTLRTCWGSNSLLLVPTPTSKIEKAQSLFRRKSNPGFKLALTVK
jgi:hypothetical protein